MVGYYTQTGSKIRLTNAAIIANWGSTNGLGEIALNGPTNNTKLHLTNGLTEFHELTEVASIVCEESKWKSKLI